MNMLDDDRKKYGIGGVIGKLAKEMQEAKKILNDGKKEKAAQVKQLAKLKKENASKEKIEDMLFEIEDTKDYIEKSELTIKMLKEYPDKNPDMLLDRIYVREQKYKGGSMKGLLQDDRKKYGMGGAIGKLFKLGGKKAPAKPTSTDIDKVLNSLTDEQMEKLSPIEIEQLLDMDLAKSGKDNIPKKSTKKTVSKSIKDMTDKELDNLSDIEIEQLLDMDLEKYGVDGRKNKMMGGLLEDERQTYGMGSLVTKLIKQGSKVDSVKVIKGLEKDAEKLYEIRNKVKANRKEYSATDYNDQIASIDDSINSINDELRELGINPSKKNFEAKTRADKAEGGMLSDNDMEENYSQFIVEEALTPEEEDMLMSKLEQDEDLQMLFDKVVDVAQEFAGNGPVEGPGSGVSDSIPARLSDGEFVFTAKAVAEIGEDTLMSMMKNAEAEADERQGFNIGGMGMLQRNEEEIEDENSNVSRDMRGVNPRLNPNVR